MTDRIDIGNLPDDLAALARRWVPILGLSEWRLTLKMTDCPNDNPHNSGGAVLNARYLRATIGISRDMDAARTRQVLLHELLHPALGLIDQATDRIIELLPEAQRTHAEQLYLDAEEQTIERLSSALVEALTTLAGSAAEA